VLKRVFEPKRGEGMRQWSKLHEEYLRRIRVFGDMLLLCLARGFHSSEGSWCYLPWWSSSVSARTAWTLNMEAPSSSETSGTYHLSALMKQFCQCTNCLNLEYGGTIILW